MSILNQNIDKSNLSNIISLFNISKKKELIKFAKKIIIQKEALANIVLAADVGIFGYSHQIYYKDRVPHHLRPSEEERRALLNNGVGELKGDALKFVRKISQTFKERNYLVGHLFYLPDLSKWHFLYFNQRDWNNKKNHWEYGSHMHFVNYLWRVNMQKLWEEFCNKGKVPGGTIHIRFENNFVASDGPQVKHEGVPRLASLARDESPAFKGEL